MSENFKVDLFFFNIREVIIINLFRIKFSLGDKIRCGNDPFAIQHKIVKNNMRKIVMLLVKESFKLHNFT